MVLSFVTSPITLGPISDAGSEIQSPTTGIKAKAGRRTSSGASTATQEIAKIPPNSLRRALLGSIM